MRTLLPVAMAGGTFAGAAVIGLIAGVLLSQRTGMPVYAPAGLGLGLAAGAVCAVALLMRSLR